MYLGAKIGILGSNGSGKSTLMKILSGIDANCEGRVSLSPGIRIGYLEQEPELKEGALMPLSSKPLARTLEARIKLLLYPRHSLACPLPLQGQLWERTWALPSKACAIWWPSSSPSV